jgi:membrane fusion protein (multidrug efflux system)
MTEAILDRPGRPDSSVKPSRLDRARGFLQRRRRVLPWVGLGLVALVIGAVLLLRYLGSFASTDDAQVDGNISSIGSRIAGTVVAVHVEDNDRVRAGDPLVELDPVDYRVALDQATANLVQARFHTLTEAKANNRLAQIDLERSRHLVDVGAVPVQDLDQRLAVGKSQAAEVQAAGANVRAAQAAVDQARLDLDYTRIAAPIAGIIGQKSVNVGDRIQAAQALLAIVQVDNLWVTANFKETQLRRMHPGQRANVHVDALDQTFRGHVESLPGASGARFSLFPPENATGNYVKVVQRLPVRIRLEPDQTGLDRLRPGMSVEPKVWLR